MAFRDDHDAALHRVAALERELAETKARLAEAEAEAEAEDDADDGEAVPAPEPEPEPEPEPATTGPAVGPMQRQAGVSITRFGDGVKLRWFGWGTGNFISTMLVFPLPVFALGLVVVWVSKGMPAARPYDLSLPWFVIATVVATWNAAVLLLNHRNQIRVTDRSVAIRQGVVPWPVTYRRRTLPRNAVRGFDVESDWDPESEHTVYRVRARLGGHAQRITGAMSEAKANVIARELSQAIDKTMR